jgi:DNA-binding SARP family transcriptional activator
VTDEGFAPRPVLEALPCGVVAVDSEGAVLGSNRAARGLLPGLETTKAPPRCNELMPCNEPGGPCEAGCLAIRAAGGDEALPEFRVDVREGGAASAVWVTGAPLRHRPGAVLHLRPGNAKDRRRRTDPHWLTGPKLRIQVLGRMRIESDEGEIGGEWLHQRPGEILKLLICERDRVVPVDEIAEAIWPDSGRRALGNTRHFIHSLRSKLEPKRTRHGHSSFIIGRSGGYAIDRDRIWIDADEFEEAVEAGLAGLQRGDGEKARERLEHAMTLYGRDLLADEPYADWAYKERDRLRELATRALHVLVKMAREREDADSHLGHLSRLADLEPFDSCVQREFLAALLLAGRRSEAFRRYGAFAARTRREFGEEPDFTLKSLGPPGA